MTTQSTSNQTPAFDYGAAKNKDTELWLEWKRTGSKESLGKLMSQVSPLVYSEVQRASGSLPVSALSAEAKKWAYKAIQTYDPSRGAALSTHITNYLPKVRRLNYKFQNAARLPENMQLQYHEYSKAVSDLAEELNRDPSEDEIAKRLGWSKPQVVRFSSRLYSDTIESQSERPAEFTKFDETPILMEYLRQQLSEDELLMLDNPQNLSVKQMCTKLGVNLNRYNYLRRKLIQKVHGIKQELGI